MSGLTLTRKVGESVIVGDSTFEIVEIKGGRVKIRIDAPRHMTITRDDCREDRKPVERVESD